MKTNEKLESLELRLSGETERLKNLNSSLEEVGKHLKHGENDISEKQVTLLENNAQKSMDLLRSYLLQQKAKKLQELVQLPSNSESQNLFCGLNIFELYLYRR